MNDDEYMLEATYGLLYCDVYWVSDDPGVTGGPWEGVVVGVVAGTA